MDCAASPFCPAGLPESVKVRLPLSLRLFTLTALATLAAVLVLFAVQQHSFRDGLLERANRAAAERAERWLSLLIRKYRETGG